MTYYKVVWKNPDESLQSICRSIPSRYLVKYEIGKWAYPSVPKTRLFVFKNLADAELFVSKSQFLQAPQIFECEVKNPAIVRNIGRMLCFAEFWRKKWSKKSTLEYSMEPPYNTYSASAVKLIRRIT